MAEPQYGEPWYVEGYRVVYGNTVESCPERHRVVKCVNLLARVPDAAPCFSPGPKADEIQLALAVLAGEFGAAAALADEIISKHQPTPKPRGGIPGLGYYRTLGEYLAQPEVGYKAEGEFKGIQSSGMYNGVNYPIIRLLLNHCQRQVLRYTNANHGRTDLFLHTALAAGRAMMDSEEFRHHSYPLGVPSGTVYGVLYTIASLDVLDTADIVVGIIDHRNNPAYVLVIQDAFR